ncbi:MAG: BON domain-containing protein [Rubrobacteraceae bacterium]
MSPGRRSANAGRTVAPATPNDAQLIQLVRGRLGRENVKGRINVSSCGLVVTLHGAIEDPAEASRIEEIVRRVRDVEDVVNKLGVRRGG